MQVGGIGLIARGAEQASLLKGRIGQHAQGLWRVRREDDGVIFFFTFLRAHAECFTALEYLLNAGIKTNLRQGDKNLLYVLARAALHRSPFGAIGDLQQTVIEAKTQKSTCR